MAAQQPSQQVPAAGMHPAAGGVMTAFIGIIATSAVAGAVAHARGNMKLYGNLAKLRMIVAATAMGFYSTSTGWIPPPPIMATITGRQPRPPAVEPLFKVEFPPTKQ